jgi:hypothetical protein
MRHRVCAVAPAMSATLGENPVLRCQAGRDGDSSCNHKPFHGNLLFQ